MSTNYGQARFAIGSQTAGSVRVWSITTALALAPRLRFHLAWALGHLTGQAPTQKTREYRITSLEGELSLAESGPAVGPLYQLGQRKHLRSLSYVDEQQNELVIDLDWFRFERLEEHRQGGPLDVWLKLWPRVETDGEALEADVNGFRVRIPREDWLTVVGAINGQQTELIEVRYHLTYAGQFQPSLQELRDARQLVERGEYAAAVIRARKALLLLEEAVRAGGDKDLKSRLRDLVDERHAKIYESLFARAKDMGNVQVHAAGARDYTRMEALFATRLAEQLLELIGSLLARTGGKARR